MQSEIIHRDFVSIITLNYNGMKWLGKFIESVLKQTYTNFELIIVDNKSSNSEVNDLIRRYSKYSKIRIIQNNINVGYARGNDLGIKVARGDLLLLVNNDTWFKETFLSELVEFKLNNRLSVVAPIEVDYDKDVNQFFGNNYSSTIDFWGNPVFTPNQDTIPKKQTFFLSGACLLMDKIVYITTGGFDNDFFMYYEDVDFFWRLQLLGNNKFGFAKEILLHHYFSGSTRSNGVHFRYNNFLWKNQNILQMLIKNFSGITLMWILPSFLLIYLTELIIFAMIGKTAISKSYLQGLMFNIKNIKRTILKRKLIQRSRVIPDKIILSRMYHGYGKIASLTNYLNNTKNA